MKWHKVNLYEIPPKEEVLAINNSGSTSIGFLMIKKYSKINSSKVRWDCESNDELLNNIQGYILMSDLQKSYKTQHKNT